jgi:hypothetical protein
MNRIVHSVVGLAVAGITLTAPAFSQEVPVVPFPPVRPEGPPDPPPSRSTVLTGKIKDVSDNVLTLTDGRRLVFLPGLTEQRGELKPGADVKASYAETAGRKVAVSIEVEDETRKGQDRAQPPK